MTRKTEPNIECGVLCRDEVEVMTDNEAAQHPGMTDDELTDLGMDFIEAGMPVFVIELAEQPTRIEKSPTTRNGHKDATLDPLVLVDQITSARKRLPEAVLGIGGVPGAAGMICIDYDTKNGARGDQVLERHRATYGDDVDAVSYWSVSGAINVLLAKPDADVKISNVSPWLDVDVRSDNGWIVVPGTTSPWGVWEWRSGDLEDLRPMPGEMAAALREAEAVESAPATSAETNAWLDEGKGPDDEFTQGELRKWIRTIDECSNRNPTLFDALSWLRRLDPAHVDRRAAFKAISGAWRARMARDGEKGRMNEPESVLKRVVGFANATEAAEAAEEAVERIESSFWEIDLGPWLDGDAVEITPTLLQLDGAEEGLLYIDRYNEIHGDSGTGKSWAAAYCVREMITTGRSVMVVDIEDNPAPLVQRLRQIAVPDRLVRELVTFIHPVDEFGPIGVGVLIEQIRAKGIVHVFIDSLGEAFALGGTKENNDDEVGPWIRDVCRRVIQETGAGVTSIDHITKTADNPLHPSGSKRKRAAITGSSWYLFALEPFDKDSGGKARFRCGKDRHGNYKTGADVADLVMEFIGAMCSLELHPVAVVDDDQATQDRDATEIAVMAAEKYRGELMSQNALHKAMREMGAKGRDAALSGAIDIAVLRGFLEQMAGPNRSRLFRFVTPYTGEMTASEWLERGES